MDRIPMCWKCGAAILDPDGENPGAFILVGCYNQSEITNYEQARQLCPLLSQHTSGADQLREHVEALTTGRQYGRNRSDG
jgi:hypothetical protein